MKGFPMPLPKQIQIQHQTQGDNATCYNPLQCNNFVDNQ